MPDSLPRPEQPRQADNAVAGWLKVLRNDKRAIFAAAAKAQAAVDFMVDWQKENRAAA